MFKKAEGLFKRSSIIILTVFILLFAGTLIFTSCSSGVDIAGADRVLTSFSVTWPAGFSYTCLSAVSVSVTISALDQDGAVMDWSGTVDILATNVNVILDPASAQLSGGTVSVGLTFDTAGLEDEDTSIRIRYGDIVTDIPGTITVDKVLAVYELTIRGDGYGSTNPEGTLEVIHGVPVNITATPDEIFAQENEFDRWNTTSGSGVAFANNRAASTTVTLTAGDATIEATFDQTDAVFPAFTAQPCNKSVMLEWEDVPLAGRYDLYYTDDGTTPSPLEGVMIQDVTSPYELPGLDNGYFYSFRLRASTGDGEQVWSGVEQAIPLSVMTLIPQVKAGYKSLTLEWKDIPGSSNYVVERSASKNGTYTEIQAAVSESDGFYSCTDSGLEKGQSYYYRVSPLMDGSIKSAPAFGMPSPFPDGGAVVVGSCLAYTADYSSSQAVAVGGNYAYIVNSTGEQGLKVIDISDPENVNDGSRVGKCTLTGGYGVAVNGDYAYVADHMYGLRIVDISNPESVTDGSLIDDYPARAIAWDVAVQGDYAYLADDNLGLTIVDVTNAWDGNDTTHPTLAGTCAVGHRALSVAVSGDYAYVADDTQGLKVINIDPLNLDDYCTVVGSCDTVAAYGVTVSGNYAYIADLNTGIKVIDVTNAWDADHSGTQPVIVGTCAVSKAQDVTVSGDLAYVSNGIQGIVVVDVSDPGSVDDNSVVGSCDTYTAYGIAVSDDYAFIADSSDGLKVADVQTPALPSDAVLASCETIGAEDIDVYGDYAFVACNNNVGSGRLDVIDISSPGGVTNGSVVGTCTWTNADTRGVYVAEDYAFVVEHTDTGIPAGRLVIIDVSDPEQVDNNSIVASCAVSDTAWDVVIRGDYAFVANDTDKLAVIDVSDPEAVDDGSIVGACTVGDGNAYHIALDGDYAYLTLQGFGISIIDISDPEGVTDASLASNECTDPEAACVGIVGDYALVGDGADLIAVDVSVPESVDNASILTGICTVGANATSFDLSGEWAIVTVSYGGIAVVDVSDASALSDASLKGMSTAANLGKDIAVRGKYGFHVSNGDGLEIIDLSPDE